ncbi:MAG TPA: CapA family protein, partial [Chloroflexia bacterium]|nr:CapA family protein [Chloroflexia bacterium]
MVSSQTATATKYLTVALVGDVMLGRLVNGPLVTDGPAYVWGNTLPLLTGADLTIGNLECVVAGRDSGRPWSHWPKKFHFKSEPAAISSLHLAGFDAVLLANNHVLDYDVEALLEMLERLERAGTPYTGAGRNLQEAS